MSEIFKRQYLKDNPEVEKEIEGKIRDAAKGNKNGEETPAEEGASETKE